MNKLFQEGTHLGIHVNLSSQEQAMEEISLLAQSGGHHYVVFLEGNLLYWAMQDSEIRRIINEADLVYPDGIVIKFLWSIHFRKRFLRVCGPMSTLKLCEYGIPHHSRHFFLGGVEKVPERMAAKLRKMYPDIEIVGTYSPPFRPMTENEEIALKTLIEVSKPDFLWVGLGGPKQEFWMNSHLGKINVPVMLGIGAAFDFHSGAKPWAPVWVRKIGMEWLFRALTGGGKTFWRNVKCVRYAWWLLIKEIFGHIFSSLQYGELDECSQTELEEIIHTSRRIRISSCQESKETN